MSGCIQEDCRGQNAYPNVMQKPVDRNRLNAPTHSFGTRAKLFQGPLRIIRFAHPVHT